MAHTVYILECADGSLYTGCTNNLEKRIREHNNGKAGAKYTRGRRPVRLVFSKKFRTLSIGRKKEAAIKRLTKKEKQEIISSGVIPAKAGI